MTPGTPELGNNEPVHAARSAARVLGGWLALALLFGYAAWLHQGVGSAPGGIPSESWHPTRFLIETEWVGQFEERPAWTGTLVLAIPAALLAIGVFVGSGSAVARWLALSGVVSCALFAFYGLYALRVWEFFHWRGSLVMVTIGLALGAALSAPLLAESWIRRFPRLGLAVYAVIFAAIVIVLRHTTGTDETLFFNFSPWPAVTIFGLELGAYNVAGFLLGFALAAIGFATAPHHHVAGVALVSSGIATPLLWLWGRFGAPPEATFVPILVVSAIGCGLVAVVPSLNRTGRLRRRAFHLALGAALVYLPLFAGRALSTGDYTDTRFVRAQRIIDALAEHFEEHELYPDDLDALVESGILESIPRPRVGFDVLYALGAAEPLEFDYQSLGSSYVLEFEFTEWVQCAYNPPWAYDDEELEEDDDEWASDELSEAWSCPESRPELW